ncbi:MAG: hypothetical protein IK092_05270 [Muribaculaceae bacterium]|nr:hypothetical protein [Muribaculaceae bacterium]
MKTIIASLIALLLLPLSARADNLEDYNVADHGLSLSQIEREWHNQCLWTAGHDGKNADIVQYFIGFSHSYPNPLIHEVEDYILGYHPGDGMLIDRENGYLRGEIFTELTCRMQMCYWHRDDGSVVVCVAFEGDEYRWEGNDDFKPLPNPDDPEDEDNWYVGVNDMMFYEIKKNEIFWWPRTPEMMCGKTFNFDQYDIQLPQQGKDIKLISKSDENKVVVLKWNGKNFDVKNK